MRTTWVMAFCAALVLAGCGGGDDDHTPPVTEQVPGSVNSSSMSFIAYVTALIASAADALEPVSTDAVTPATDDAGEPQPVS